MRLFSERPVVLLWTAFLGTLMGLLALGSDLLIRFCLWLLYGPEASQMTAPWTSGQATLAGFALGVCLALISHYLPDPLQDSEY